MSAMPNPSSNDAQAPAPLKHSDTCATVFLRSIYDKSCPRCNKINMAIQLSRKTIANGASPMESVSALRTYQIVVTKFGLKPAELVDRLYASVTNKITRPPTGRRPTRAERRVVGEDEI